MSAPKRTSDPPQQPVTVYGVRIYEGEPDERGHQYVRVVQFAPEDTEQMLAFYHRVVRLVTQWNSEGTGYYRYPELVERTLSPWAPVAS